jgi:hypothetical protein
MEFPVVGAFPMVADLTHVVGELFAFTKVQFVGTKVVAVNPSLIGSAIAVEPSAVM